MIGFPNAKINIGLNIVEKRSDNFHNIESVFFPIPLSDILEIIEVERDATEKVTISITGMPISGSSDSNLCVKAYRILDKQFNLPPVKIILHKLVPMGAGMGGGSSDGTFTLKLLNSMFNLELTDNQLVEYASQLGSDCAFFIENQPAFGTGKGNILSPIHLDLKGYYMVIVKPEVFVGTAEAYAGVKPCLPAVSLSSLIHQPIENWKNTILNDFEKSIFGKHSEIEHIKNELYTSGAIYASMTGSGSAVFGLFKGAVELKSHFPDCFYWGGLL